MTTTGFRALNQFLRVTFLQNFLIACVTFAKPFGLGAYSKLPLISCIINLVLYWNVQLLAHCEAIVVLVQDGSFVLGNHDRICLVVELPHW